MRHSTLSPKYLQSTRGKSKPTRPRHLAAKPSRFALPTLSPFAVRQTLHAIDRYHETADHYFENREGNEFAYEDDRFIKDISSDFTNASKSLVNLVLAWDHEIRETGLGIHSDETKGLFPARGIIRDGHLYIATADHDDRIELLADPSKFGETHDRYDRMQLLVIPLSSIVDLDSPSDPGGDPGLEERANGAGQGDPSPAGDVEAIFVAPVPSLA